MAEPRKDPRSIIGIEIVVGVPGNPDRQERFSGAFPSGVVWANSLRQDPSVRALKETALAFRRSQEGEGAKIQAVRLRFGGRYYPMASSW